MCIHTCINTSMYIIITFMNEKFTKKIQSVNPCIHIYTYACINTYKYVYAYIQMCICIYTNMYIHIYKYVYTYVYTNMYIHIYSYVYTYEKHCHTDHARNIIPEYTYMHIDACMYSVRILSPLLYIHTCILSVRIHTYIHTCILYYHTYMHTYIHEYTYIHAYRHVYVFYNSHNKGLRVYIHTYI